MNYFIFNIKFIFAKLLCKLLKIDILKITEPSIPEIKIPILIEGVL